MKKVLLGLISIIMAGQISFAQPVSDMAVIPMGITIQSVMRLSITKGGNMEFVFKSAADLSAGIPATFGPAYETKGKITTTQNWDLELTTDEGAFTGDVTGSIPLTVVEFAVSTGSATTTVIANGPILTTANVTPIELLYWDNTGGTNRGSGIDFGIQWACGSQESATGTGIPANQNTGRYAVNVVLSLIGTSH